MPSDHRPIIAVVGGDELSDEAIALWADYLVAVWRREQAEQQQTDQTTDQTQEPAA